MLAKAAESSTFVPMPNSDSKKVPTDSEEGDQLSPSQFMRGLRPEYYSDTKDRVAYVLEPAVFEHWLETITQRNQTHEFEIFARKLCERVICPNLRPLTGPDGGGDSKADSETYPVADEITRIYIGHPNAGRERWAFAFSAKKKWAEKVKNDVRGIVETGRVYQRIVCITSRSAKSKDRARIEDELSKRYGIAVTIHDRTWLVKEVIEGDRKDLAHNYLGIGEAKSDPLRLGPTDYSRTQQLSDIEKSLDDPAAFEGMERQRATEALIAAKLSRNVERPRAETDGRFMRAIKLADADGSYRQQLQARYEHLWTTYWWFDDAAFVNDSYDAFGALAFKSEHARNLELVCNLFQLLTNSVIFGHLDRAECKYDERWLELRKALDTAADNSDRPNNSLEAQTSLLILKLGRAMVDKSPDDLLGIWRGFSDVLKRARGLGEFEVRRLTEIIQQAGQIAGNDPAYNTLIEELSEFVRERTSEAEGARILLHRAQKLDFSDRFDMIRLLGKAAVGLTKKEYASDLVEALQLLMIAYRSARLPWAARATCAFAAATLAIEGDEDGQLPINFVPTMKVWSWLAFELKHLPDLLFGIQVMNGALASLPLAEESKSKVRDDIRELDVALGSLLLSINDEELHSLEKLPDLLEVLGLFTARSALLYALGYEATLREDGSIPEGETPEAVNQLFSTLASQPIAKETHGPLILNMAARQVRVTKILGMSVELELQGSDELIVAGETVLAALEAFFATAIERGVAPHTERVRISLISGATGEKPTFELNELDMVATLKWPPTLSLSNFVQQKDVYQFLMVDVAGSVLATTCMVEDAKGFLDRLFADEAVHNRIMMAIAAVNSFHRVASKNVLRLSDWQEHMKKVFTPLPVRPELKRVDLAQEMSSSGRASAPGIDPTSTDNLHPRMPKIMTHRGVSVRSVINVHAWNRAQWRGVLYAHYADDSDIPPGMGLLFEDKTAAEKIFTEWRERIGETDDSQEIHVAIIRHIPNENAHHYIVSITANPEAREKDDSQVFIAPNRSLTMQPNDSFNLERFLASYGKLGEYYLMPAVLSPSGRPVLGSHLSILKRSLSVKSAKEIGEHDIEGVALRIRGFKRESSQQDTEP